MWISPEPGEAGISLYSLGHYEVAHLLYQSSSTRLARHGGCKSTKCISSSSSQKLIRCPLQGLSSAVQSGVDSYAQKTNRKVLKTNKKLRL